MTSTEGPPPSPTPDPPRAPTPLPQRSGCLTGLMIVIGIILLLPGLCAIIFGGIALTEPRFDSSFLPSILFGVAVGIGGIFLIRAALRGPKT
jgi:uncharacterized membrane protein HdeD (DUF308 family)